MALDFPSSPALNDTYTSGGKTWKWNGSGWQLVSDGVITTTNLSNSSVTYAKIQNVAANTILGNSTSSSGTVSEISCTSAGRDLLAAANAAAQLSTLGAATSTHVHGSITNAGAIGLVANLPIITGGNGVLGTGTFGSDANTFCQGNDARLSDKRNTVNLVTFNNGGGGGNSGSTFDGSAALTVSYNTIGAPGIGAGNAFTGSNTFTNATGQIFRQSATNDGILLRGRAGGSVSRTVELVPTSLTGDRTLTLPNVDGTVITTGSTSVISTGILTNQAVTYAKIQYASANTILGNDTNSLGTVAEISCTLAGRNLIAGADAAAQRTTLGLGSLATANTITTSSVTDTGGSSWSAAYGSTTATNISGAPAPTFGSGDFFYTRVGTVVTVTGKVIFGVVTPNSLFVLPMTIPVSRSNFSGANAAAGCAADEAGALFGRIASIGSSQEVAIRGQATSTGNKTVGFSYSYTL